MTDRARLKLTVNFCYLIMACKYSYPPEATQPHLRVFSCNTLHTVTFEGCSMAVEPGVCMTHMAAVAAQEQLLQYRLQLRLLGADLQSLGCQHTGALVRPSMPCICMPRGAAQVRGLCVITSHGRHAALSSLPASLSAWLLHYPISSDTFYSAGLDMVHDVRECCVKTQSCMRVFVLSSGLW